MTTAPPRRRRSLTAILGPPTVLAAAAAAGLGSGLMGDGMWDVVASLCIGISLVAILWALARSRAC